MSSSLDVRIGSQRPRLSHLPPGRVGSAGPDAVEFAASCGLVLDEWQCWCLEHLLAEDAAGRWCAQQAALIVPRQNGKNAVLEALELYAFYVLDEPKILHTAHRTKTSAEHMQRMRLLVGRNPDLDRITYPYLSNGKEALERTDTGARLEFMTRGKGSVRGGSPTRVVFDEALFLTDAHLSAIIPSMSAQSMNVEGAPQFIYASSAPLPESEVLHRVRQRGQSARPGPMFYAEWSNEPGVDPEDRVAWYAANPGMGIRISEEWVADNELPPSMSVDGFLTERLGVVFITVEGRDAKIPLLAWESAATTATPPEGEPVTMAYEVSMDGEWSSIVVAAGDQATPYVEQIEHRKGVGWLPGRLVELVRDQCPTRLACVGSGPAGAQVGPVMLALSEAGLETPLEQLSMVAYRQACGAFYSDVVEGRLSWFAGGGPLDLAAKDAAARIYGDSWSWDIRNATVPVSPLVAATVARALLPVEAPREQRKARVHSF